MLNLLLLLDPGSWNINPLDYGPLAGIIAVVFIFLNKISTVVDYAKHKDIQVENITTQTNTALIEVSKSLNKLRESLDSQKYLFEKIITDILDKQLKSYTDSGRIEYREIKILLEDIKRHLDDMSSKSS